MSGSALAARSRRTCNFPVSSSEICPWAAASSARIFSSRASGVSFWSSMTFTRASPVRAFFSSPFRTRTTIADKARANVASSFFVNTSLLARSSCVSAFTSRAVCACAVLGGAVAASSAGSLSSVAPSGSVTITFMMNPCAASHLRAAFANARGGGSAHVTEITLPETVITPQAPLGPPPSALACLRKRSTGSR